MSHYGGYLIYHPTRAHTTFGNMTIYHDATQTNANQDPYIWNTQFLHTYCHRNHLSPHVEDINFWVSRDPSPLFSHLYCDLVFVVKEKIVWPKEQTNALSPAHPMIDSKEAYIDHYQWPARGQHYYKKWSRFTLKADPLRSFQPQNEHGRLIDIVDILQDVGLPLATLRKTAVGARPFPIDAHTAQYLYDRLNERAYLHLTGAQLQPFRHAHPDVLSSEKLGKPGYCGKVDHKPPHVARCV